MQIEWDARARVALIRCASKVCLRGVDARALVDALTRWTGDDARIFGVLVDLAEVPMVDAEYRATMRDYGQLERERVRVAVFHMSSVLRVMAEMYRLGSGVALHGFDDEAAARGWLRREGVGA